MAAGTLRDAAYRWVARNRYRLFGRSERCMLPSAAQAGRFLDAGSSETGPAHD